MSRPPWSWGKFDQRYAAQSLRARERLRRRRQRSAEQADQRAARRAKLSPFLRGWIESLSIQAQARRLAAHERLLHGFRWPGGMVNGRNFAPFVAHRLRSSLHPILRLFVSRLRRTGTLLSGDRKSMSPHMQGQPKLVQLDQPYVSFNTVMQGVIRIDLDHDFPSWERLRTAILEAGLPAPNFCVAHVAEGGRVQHPHAYYLLATAVCHGRNGRSRPRNLLRAVRQGMVDALHGIGADPGGLSNPHSGKNPLSELWSCSIMASDPYNLAAGPSATPGLAALTDHIRPVFARPSQALAIGDDAAIDDLLLQSNGAFHVLRRHITAQVARYHLQGAYDAFVVSTVVYARGLAERCGRSEASLERLGRQMADFGWALFGRQGKRPDRGRCRQACTGKPLVERQRIGALDVAARKRQATLDGLVAAHRRLVASSQVEGGMPLNQLLADEAGVTVRTVQKHKADLLAALGLGGERRCRDKKRFADALPLPNKKDLFLSPPTPTLPRSVEQSAKENPASAIAPGSCSIDNGAMLIIPSPARLSTDPPCLRTLPAGQPPFIPPGLDLFPPRQGIPPPPAWVSPEQSVASPSVLPGFHLAGELVTWHSRDKPEQLFARINQGALGDISAAVAPPSEPDVPRIHRTTRPFSRIFLERQAAAARPRRIWLTNPLQVDLRTDSDTMPLRPTDPIEPDP